MKKILRGFTVVAIFLILFIGCGSSSSNSTETANNNNTLLIYKTGSDLEENYSLATEDLLEILKGYDNLTLQQRTDLNIVVAFGGSRTKNWQGIKYADIECLKKDSQNGSFGDDSCYLYEDDTANMGSYYTFKEFLSFSKSYTSNSKRNYLVLWNHGGAYDGICYDSNKLWDQLSITELNNALSNSGSYFDMIGMDACLMANIEVANGIKDYADYFIASEENEPGHGWDYEEVVYTIGSSTEENITTVGKNIVDSFITSDKHKYTSHKTLSLIDLSKVENTVNKIESFFLQLEVEDDFLNLGGSAFEAQSYNDGQTIDLKNLSTMMKNKKSSLQYDVELLSSAVDDMIVYNRYEVGKEDSYGISIYNPLNSTWEFTRYKNLKSKLSDNFNSVITDFTSKRDMDYEVPLILSEDECIVDNNHGHCIESTDNLGIKDAITAGWLPYGYGDYFLLFTQKLENEDSTYFMPRFNDEWYYLCSGESEECIFPSTFELNSRSDQFKLYETYGKHNDEAVKFFIKTFTNGTVEMFSTPNYGDEYGIKQQRYVTKGDTISFEFYLLSGQWVDGNTLTLNADPSWVKTDLNASVDYLAMIEDFNYNVSYSYMYNNSLE
ncbi:MAG: clostripain-related cysteine peptidase [Campylobacterota bacterium]|nr:clostripain-related cysteine peptidase [Campylobacterota bacterium]